MVGNMPYPAIQKMFDGMLPPGLQWYWRSDFFNELGAEQRKIHREFGSKIPTPLSQMHLYPITGAAARTPKSKTAWASRDAKYAGVIVGIDADRANAEKITKWCKDYWEAAHPFSSGGAYLNFIQDEDRIASRQPTRKTMKDLTKIKRTYDPDNFFRINQNILPGE